MFSIFFFIFEVVFIFVFEIILIFGVVFTFESMCAFIFRNNIQEAWVDGIYPQQTWCCFSRNEENTNNPQEAYNGVLNPFRHGLSDQRLVKGGGG